MPHKENQGSRYSTPVEGPTSARGVPPGKTLLLTTGHWGGVMAAIMTGIAHGVGQQVGGSSQHFPGFWGDLDSK